MPLPVRARGAIFDLDGTVFDSIGRTAGLVSEVASEFLGRTVTFADAVSVLGKSPEEIGAHFGLSGSALSEFKKSLPKRFLEKVEGFPLIPGTEKTLSFLSERGIKIGAVSGAPKRNMERFLSKAGISGRFSAIVSAEDFSGGKLSGLPFLKACEIMGTLPEETISVGDAPLDANGARNAGCFPVGVLSGSGTEEELNSAMCREIIASIAELPGLLERKGFI